MPTHIRVAGRALYWLRDRLNEAPSEKVRTTLEKWSRLAPVPSAKVDAYAQTHLPLRFGSRRISEYTTMRSEDASTAFAGIKLNAREELIAGRFCAKSSASWVSQHGRSRLFDPGSAFIDVIRRRGAADPSGDRLARGFGGVLYVLDDDSPRRLSGETLLETLCALRDLGNTVLVVEHDEKQSGERIMCG